MNNRPLNALANRAFQWLDIALVSAVSIQIVLYIARSIDSSYFNNWQGVEQLLYATSLSLLIVVVCSRYFYHASLIRQKEAGGEQLDAMLDMFRVVKHKLDNDMQVVMGNAELADILVNAGGDVSKPVQNITAAANHAVERIAQLSVFGSSGRPNPALVDLNALFRQAMAKMAEELPAKVTLRLELGHLPCRVFVDRCLLSLSLSHLIRLCVASMREGGEIVIRTSDDYRGDGNTGTVLAEVFIVWTARPTMAAGDDAVADSDGEELSLSDNAETCRLGFKTFKALVVRSGVKGIKLTHAKDESLFIIRFATEIQPDTSSENSSEAHLQKLFR